MITDRRIIPDEFKEDGIDKDYDDIFMLICKNINIDIKKERFVYFIDENYVLDTTKGVRYENLTPNYEVALEGGFADLRIKDEKSRFEKSYNIVIDGLECLINRILRELEKKEMRDTRQYFWFQNMMYSSPQSFEEAIQRLLFVNQIFWQTDHRLTAMGAWDAYLFPYYNYDVTKGVISREDALCIIEDIYRILHKDYKYKSNVLMGDTGQVFVLGRSNEEGEYICNELTYLFIEGMMSVQQPEPKCLLRVNKNTPRDLIELSLKSILTGIGAPLFANDDKVIPALLDFGIEPKDAYLYTTSACWEPLIGGKSTSMNNRTVLNFLRALENLFRRENLERIDSFERLLELYFIYLRRNIKAVKRVLRPHRFGYDPLLSVFTEGCRENSKDVSQGGAKYHDVGITSVAMGNTVNSLLNIKKMVFDERKFTLFDIKKSIILNFEDNLDIFEFVKNQKSKYACDEDYIIELVNDITKVVAEEIADFIDYQGGKLKVGLSGSAYMDAARGFSASCDGRKENDPFNVHISNEDSDSYTEVISFASKMNYLNGLFNGNVVDLMVNPSFIKDNWDKFVGFLITSIKCGFFELQMNVVSSEILIEARKNPEKFPNLIVRVWGFSSYYNDLPEEYKDLLIHRALQNEKA